MSAPVSDVCGDLLKLFAEVPDGRVGQGRDHPVAAVLALAAAAARMRATPRLLAGSLLRRRRFWHDLHLCGGATPAPPPSKTTIWRVLTDADAEAFEVAAGTWLMTLAGFTTPAAAIRDTDQETGPQVLMQVRLDGKAIRAARDAGGTRSACSRRWPTPTPPAEHP